MHWHLALALLLTVLACSARSECQSFADFLRQVNNTGRGNYKAEVLYSVKFHKLGSPDTSSTSMQTSDKERIATSALTGVSFAGIAGSASVSYGTENEVKKQIAKFDNAQWKEIARQSMNKEERLYEEYDVPSGSGISVFQVRLVCDGYEISLPRLITVMTAFPL